MFVLIALVTEMGIGNIQAIDCQNLDPWPKTHSHLSHDLQQIWYVLISRVHCLRAQNYFYICKILLHNIAAWDHLGIARNRNVTRHFWFAACQCCLHFSTYMCISVIRYCKCITLLLHWIFLCLFIFHFFAVSFAKLFGCTTGQINPSIKMMQLHGAPLWGPIHQHIEF